MDYESIGRNLMNYGVYGYVLNFASSGTEICFMQRKGEDYVPCHFWHLDFDMLSGFDSLRKVMQTETLVISWTSFNTFEAELSHKKREGGYKEPFHKEVYATKNGRSILEVLGLLNEEIELKKQVIEDAKLELIKKENI